MYLSDHVSGLSRSLSQRNRIVLVVLLTVAATFLFLIFYPRLGRSSEVLPAIPVVTAAGLLGLRAGLWALVANFGLITLLAPLIGEDFVGQLTTPTGLLFTSLMVATTYFFGRMHDLSARLQSELQRRYEIERSLIEAQRVNKRITETIPDTIWIWELDTLRLNYINQLPSYLPALNLEQLKREGLLPLEELVHPEDLLQYKTGSIVRTMSDDAVHQFEYRVRQPNGTYRRIQAREVVFSRQADGTPRYIMNVEQDVTEERQAIETHIQNEKLQFALDKEREMSRLRTRLMEIISHEFRTPLSIILASSELIEMYLDRMSPERRAECLKAIKTQTVHLREMLNDLNLVLDQEANPPRFRPQKTNIRHLCETLIDTVRLTAGAHHNLNLNMQGNLSDIDADREILLPILQNLLSNAFKYSPAGSTVYITVERQDSEIVYRIRDEGMGIPMEDKARIYDTFYRSHNTVSTSGLGLGLKVVRDYVRLHQGRIEVESVEGKGTTFTVYLPLTYPAKTT